MGTRYAHNVEIAGSIPAPRTKIMLREHDLKYFRQKLKICKVHNKPCYTKKDALTHKNRRMKEAHVRLRVYACPNGNHWHLTSKL